MVEQKNKHKRVPTPADIAALDNASKGLPPEERNRLRFALWQARHRVTRKTLTDYEVTKAMRYARYLVEKGKLKEDI